MVWPLITKNDVSSFCEPFQKENSLPALQKQNFAGVVFFDVGSVLLDLDWESFWSGISGLLKPSYKFSLDKFKSILQKENLNSIWSQGKISTRDYVDTVIKIIKLSCEEHEKINISCHDLKNVDSLIVSSARKRSLECVKKLKEKNFVVGLLSNTTPWHISIIYEKLQVNKNFDVLIFSNDVGHEKPDAQIYQVAHNEACKFVKNKFNRQLEKKEVYFIDDTPINVRAALAFGWTARLVNLVKDEILNRMQHNKMTDLEFQQASQKRENLLFGDQAAKRVETLFGNLLQ